MIKLDATNKVLGRLASEIAIILRGKNKPDFVPHLLKGEEVIVENIDKIKITGKKLENKIYYHHSGYPGGLKKRKMKEISPAELLRKAVYNMLPKNKLRKEIIKRLKIQV
jgi:large subunit ribosomal protein L13